MEQIRAYFPVGLGVELPNTDPRHAELTHPINSKLEYSLHARALGRHEHDRLGKGNALIPHYRERQGFPYKNSSSIPDGLNELAEESPATESRSSFSPAANYRNTTHNSYDFTPTEHQSMGMDPHENIVPEVIPGLSTDSSSLSELSDSVLSPMPHPLGSQLNVWHNNNEATRGNSSKPGTPRYPLVGLPDTSADDTIATQKLQYTRKKRLRHPSLLRTPRTVRTADWEDAFKAQWERGLNEPEDGLLLPGLPQLPIMPTNRVLMVDNEPCDSWGRKQCTAQRATVLVIACCLFPPFWLLIGAGYADGIVGVVPRPAKLISFALGTTTLLAAIIIAAVLASV